MKLVTKLSHIFDRTINLSALLAAITIIFILSAVILEIAMRYILGRGTSWVLEYTEYGLLYVAMLGAAWLLKKEGHVKMDLILNQLKPKPQALVNIITSITCAIVCLIITWYGILVTWFCFQSGYFFSTILRTPKWPIVLIIPLGSFLLFIQSLRRSYSFVKVWRTSQK